MIIDKRTMLCDNVELSVGGVGPTVIGDSVDVGDAGPDLGITSPLYVVAIVTEDGAGGGDLTLKLVSDNVAPAATDGTATTHITFGPVPAAEVKAGKVLGAVQLPMGQPYERYLSVIQEAGIAFTAGKVSVFFTPTPDA